MLTPNGLLVSVRIFLISSRIASSSPDDVSMMPRPPAFDTADASCARAIQPIGAWMTGISTPSNSVTRFLNSIRVPFTQLSERYRQFEVIVVDPPLQRAQLFRHRAEDVGVAARIR